MRETGAGLPRGGGGGAPRETGIDSVDDDLSISKRLDPSPQYYWHSSSSLPLQQLTQWLRQ